MEVTCRALHSRLLFRPRPLMNEIIIGTLARARQRHQVRVCFFVCFGNHMHLLLWAEDARELSSFMSYFLSKLAREVGRLTGWKEKIFGRRYTSIVVSGEEAAQVERLRYCLAHGAKEDLVERPRDWPGVHCVRALLEGEILEGLWFDRTQEYLARRRGEKLEPLQYATREVLELDPLPCWEPLTAEQRRARIAALVEDIESEAAARRKRTGAKPLGVAAVLAQDPLQRPKKTKKVACAGLPRSEQSRPSRALGRLRPVRGGLPYRRREAPGRGPRRGVPPRELPAGAAVRERVAGGATS